MRFTDFRKSVQLIFTLFSSILFTAGLNAQSASLGVSSAGGAPGVAVSVNLTLSASAGALPAGLQWTLAYPTNLLGPVTFAPGPSLTAAGKSLTCAAGAGAVTCIASGANDNTISSGILAVAVVPILANVTGSLATLTPTNVLAVLPAGFFAAISSSGGAISINTPAPVTVSSLAVSPTTVVGGNNVTGTVTLSGAAPSGGVTVSVTSSNPAVIPATNITVAASGTSQTFNLATLAVSASTTVSVTASYNGTTATSSITVNPPASSSPTGAAAFLKSDSTTQGSWEGVYGGDGYNVIGDVAAYPSYVTVTPAGAAAYTWASSTTDPRALEEPPPATNRIAACWYGASSFTVDLKFQDTNTHQMALYLLDFDGGGRSETVAIVDANGNVLDTRTVSGFSGGEYLLWNLSGHVVVRVTNNNSQSNAVVSGLFFGSGASLTTTAGSGASATTTGAVQYVNTDTTTAGSWKNSYGGDGFNVIGDVASYPSYATATASGNSYYVWESTTTDPRALQTAESTVNRVAACWYGSTLSINLAFNDGGTHQVAIYLVDFDGDGRSETVQILDMNGKVLDTRSVSNFSGGDYLVWNLSGQLVLKISSNSSSTNAVVSGIFFGGPYVTSPSASFIKTDVSTIGNWHGVYGADGFNVIGDVASYPSYVTTTAAGNASYVWESSSTDPRALQTAASTINRVAACWYGSTFTINLAFQDNATHQVALYLVDFDNDGRSENVKILDINGNLLDTRSVSNFAGGQYLVWNLTGKVVLQLTNTSTAPNAVVSGIFFR